MQRERENGFMLLERLRWKVSQATEDLSYRRGSPTPGAYVGGTLLGQLPFLAPVRTNERPDPLKSALLHGGIGGGVGAGLGGTAGSILKKNPEFLRGLTFQLGEEAAEGWLRATPKIMTLAGGLGLGTYGALQALMGSGLRTAA